MPDDKSILPTSPTLKSEDDAPDPTPALSKSDIHFAFGPKHWYWARFGTRWRFVRSNASDWSKLGVNEAHWVAFRHDTGFIIGGEDDDGNARVVHSWNDGYMVRADEAEALLKSREAYINLFNWLTKHIDSKYDNLKDTSLSIGPKGSYFARCRTSHITHALPKDLQTSLKKSNFPPLTIALGVRGAWVVLFADGSRDWNLRHAYPALASTGKLGSKENKVIFVALNPYVDDEFFIVTEDGDFACNASFSDQKEGKTFYQMTEEYMQSRAKRDGVSFSAPMRINGVERRIEFTPGGGVLTRGSGMLWRARRNMVSRDVLLCSTVAGGTGMLARVLGMPVARAVGLGFAAGGGAAAAMWYRM